VYVTDVLSFCNIIIFYELYCLQIKTIIINIWYMWRNGLGVFTKIGTYLSASLLFTQYGAYKTKNAKNWDARLVLFSRKLKCLLCADITVNKSCMFNVPVRRGRMVVGFKTCNQCLSPLTLWVRILLMARFTRYKIMW
jgi:hypothetical protein